MSESFSRHGQRWGVTRPQDKVNAMHEVCIGPLDWIRKMGYYSRADEELDGKIYLSSHREPNTFAFLDVSENEWTKIVLITTIIDNGAEVPGRTKVYTCKQDFEVLCKITSFIYDPSVIIRWHAISPDFTLENIFREIVEREVR